VSLSEEDNQEDSPVECEAGIVLKPATSLKILYPVLEDVDLVLIMSSIQGFGGQSFIPSPEEDRTIEENCRSKLSSVGNRSGWRNQSREHQRGL